MAKLVKLVCKDCQGANDFPQGFYNVLQMGKCYYCGADGIHEFRTIPKQSFGVLRITAFFVLILIAFFAVAVLTMR